MPPEELDHLIGRVEAEATRMGLLVEDLLTLARLDQQRPLNIAPVDVLTLAADAVQDARIVSPGRPIDLIVAPGTAFLVNGDEQRLRQVLGNLVNNALTHTPAGTPVRVKIGAGTLPPTADRQAGGAPSANGTGFADGAGSTAAATERPVPAVVLDVEDDGPGMPAEQAQRVFERFYRADAARNRASGGTGLGLAIVAGLVNAHGGTVSVRTAPGRGADFQVRLPLSPTRWRATTRTTPFPTRVRPSCGRGVRAVEVAGWARGRRRGVCAVEVAGVNDGASARAGGLGGFATNALRPRAPDDGVHVQATGPRNSSRVSRASNASRAVGRAAVCWSRDHEGFMQLYDNYPSSGLNPSGSWPREMVGRVIGEARELVR